MTAPLRPGIPRRRVLVGLLLVPPALGGCALPGAAPEEPDPLVALAAAARDDAALAAAAISAAPALADRVQPLVDARREHAAALDGEVARRDPDRPSAAAPTAPTGPVGGPPAAPVSLEQVRAAVSASGRAAAGAALELPVERIGLVASVAACCAAYAAVLA